MCLRSSLGDDVASPSEAGANTGVSVLAADSVWGSAPSFFATKGLALLSVVTVEAAPLTFSEGAELDVLAPAASFGLELVVLAPEEAGVASELASEDLPPDGAVVEERLTAGDAEVEVDDALSFAAAVLVAASLVVAEDDSALEVDALASAVATSAAGEGADALEAVGSCLVGGVSETG